jgi:hypothetical protein
MIIRHGIFLKRRNKMAFFTCQGCGREVGILVNSRCMDCNNGFNPQKKKKYIVVGGNPIKVYTGTQTYTSLKQIDIFDNKEEANKCIKDNYEECGGLIDVFEVEYE